MAALAGSSARGGGGGGTFTVVEKEGEGVEQGVAGLRAAAAARPYGFRTYGLGFKI